MGELEPHVLDQYCMDSHRDIYVLSNVVEKWPQHRQSARRLRLAHRSLLTSPSPPPIPSCTALETPSEGGDTLFCSTYAAFETLPEADQARLQALRGLHSYRHLHSKKRGVAPLTAGQLARTPDVTHPMIRVHPISGRKSLYLGGNCLAGLHGVDDAEAWHISTRCSRTPPSPSSSIATAGSRAMS